ncbi:PAS domain S-box protein [Actinoplanes sp. NPDC049668]|jgi:PAS domain S-box-containing protein|uniref:PAS domain S-box protein n=1 Tax=unclassified Actinoplanes TaxID=2626549 RepID=UPI0033BC5DFE
MNAPADSLGWPAGESRLAEASAPVAGGDAALADIVRSSHDAIVAMTLEGVVTAWNRAAEQLYGYRAEEIIGRRAEQLYPPTARAGEAVILRRIARGERLDQYVGDRIRRDGSTVTVRLSVSPIAGDAGVVVGVAVAARRAPDSGRDTQPAQETVLSTRTSHELRTPLQAVIGFTGTLLLRLPGPLNDEQVRQLELVQESARQLLELINEKSRPVDG